MEKVHLEVNTNASGAGTDESDQTYKGFIEKVVWVDGFLLKGIQTSTINPFFLQGLD